MNTVVIFYPHITEFGGIERNIIALAQEIHAQGNKPMLLCYYDKINLTQYANGKLEIAHLQDHWNPFVKSKSLRNWLDLNERRMHKTMFVFGAKAGFYAGLAKLTGYALHYTDPPSLLIDSKTNPIREWFLRPKRIWSDKMIAKGVKQAGICLTMTKWNAEELQRLYNRKFEVVYQGGVPVSSIKRTTHKLSPKNLRLFSICRITTSKNLQWILHAANHLRSINGFKENVNGLNVIIAGKGPELDGLRELTKNLGLQHQVSFPGFLTAEQMEEQFSLADFFLVPGRQGYGLPVLEALYRHVPVVLNKESRISEFLAGNSWVKVCENSSDSFTEALMSHLTTLSEVYPSPDEILDLPTESGWARKIGKICGWW